MENGKKKAVNCGAVGSEVPGAAPAGCGRFRVGDVVHLVQEHHHLRPLGTRPLRQDLLHDCATGEQLQRGGVSTTLLVVC